MVFKRLSTSWCGRHARLNRCFDAGDLSFRVFKVFHQFNFNLAAELQRTMGVDITTIDGVDVMTTGLICPNWAQT